MNKYSQECSRQMQNFLLSAGLFSSLLGISEGLISSTEELKSPSILKLYFHSVDCSRMEGRWVGASGFLVPHYG